MILLSFILAALGLGCLGLTNARHHDWALGRGARTLGKRLLRIAACITFAGSFGAALAGWGVAQGSVGWFGLVTLAAAMLLAIRTYLPGRARR